MAKFNTYIEHPEIERWRDLCVNEGELCRYNKGEVFVSVGRVARYIGYVKSGTLKYVAYDESGVEHVVGLEFAGEFVADFPFSLREEPSRLSIFSSCFLTSVYTELKFLSCVQIVFKHASLNTLPDYFIGS